jgi:hypothetical protein
MSVNKKIHLAENSPIREESIDDVEIVEEVTPKRGRGRPPGSGNKKSTQKTPKKSGEKRGRKRKVEEENDQNGNADDQEHLEQEKKEKEWEVEAILLSRSNEAKNNQPEFYVKWKGWSIEESTWEPAATLKEDLPAMVKDFEQNLKNKIQEEYRNVQDGEDIPLKCTKLLDSRDKEDVSSLVHM